MTWSDLQQAAIDIVRWAAAHPVPAAAALAGVLVLAAFFIAFDVVVTDRGVSVVFIRWTVYFIPFGTIKKVYPSPFVWEVSLFGFRFGNDPFYATKWTRVLEITFDPFAKRVYVERTDDSLVILAPADRDKFIRDVNAHLHPEPVSFAEAEAGAEAVIWKRIAQERADEHE